MHRRSYLKNAAAAVMSPLFPISKVWNPPRNPPGISGRQQEFLDEVPPFSRVGFFPGAIRVPADHWIIHEGRWRTDPTEGPGKLKEVLQKTTHTYSIDGTPISNAEEYWQDIQPSGDCWLVRWEYLTRPKSVGIHSIDVEITFNRPFRTLHSGKPVTMGGTYSYGSSYEVIE